MLSKACLFWHFYAEEQALTEIFNIQGKKQNNT